MQNSRPITEKHTYHHICVNIKAIVMIVASIPMFYGSMFIIRLYLNIPLAYLFDYN